MLQTHPQRTPSRTTQLDLDQIQGNLIGFHRPVQCFLFARFPKRSQANAWLWLVSSEIATGRDVQESIDSSISFNRAWINVGLTYRGLATLSAPKLEEFPDDFKRGMRDPRTTMVNRDVDLSEPARWVFPADRDEIHAVLLLAADTQADLDAEVSRQITTLAAQGIQLLFKQDASGYCNAPDHYHARLDESDAPGDFIVGHALRRAGAISTGWPSPLGPTALYHNGQRAPRGPRPAWTVNGSYLVIRRMRQAVGRIREFTYHLNYAASADDWQRQRLLCRGARFGRPFRGDADPISPEGANAAFPNDRGLVLVSYQSSIHDGFEFLQDAWRDDPSTEAGWMITTGGDYFLSPSIDALAMLGGEQVPHLRMLINSE